MARKHSKFLSDNNMKYRCTNNPRSTNYRLERGDEIDSSDSDRGYCLERKDFDFDRECTTKRHDGRHDEHHHRKESRNYERGSNSSSKLPHHGQSILHEGNRNRNLNTDVSSLGKRDRVYVPPYKLARKMKEVEDKSSIEYQRLTWDALKKSINGVVNKVNAANVKNIIPELFSENLIRGRSLLCRSIMKSQMASPAFTDVLAALVAVVNTKFPEVGQLMLRRIVLKMKIAFKRNDKPQLLAAVKFIAHLVNQQVAHEIVALELLTVLLDNPSDDSVEVAVWFVRDCGSMLQDLSPRGLRGIFDRFLGILHEGEFDKRVQFLIEGLLALRKAKFNGCPAIRPELDLVKEEDQFTHEVSLQDEIDPEDELNLFKPDPDFIENEKRYEEVKKTILGGEESEDDDEDDESEEDDEHHMQIRDETDTNLVNLRRTIYQTIMNSLTSEEAGHKLLQINLKPGQEMELCTMLLECCSREKDYLSFYGRLGERLCMVSRIYRDNFERCFIQQYSMVHRLETNNIRNVASFYAHLLATEALPWHCLSYISLTEKDTTSSSRIFIKILFQEVSKEIDILNLSQRLNDPAMQDSFESIFPRDNPRNTRFAINFFISIGLGLIAENLRREYLDQQQSKAVSEKESESSGSSDSESESSSDDDENESDRDERREKKRKRRDY